MNMFEHTEACRKSGDDSCECGAHKRQLAAISPPIAAEPFDLDAWNQSRLDACRITGTTYEQQNDAISPAAHAYAQSVEEQNPDQSDV